MPFQNSHVELRPTLKISSDLIISQQTLLSYKGIFLVQKVSPVLLQKRNKWKYLLALAFFFWLWLLNTCFKLLYHRTSTLASGWIITRASHILPQKAITETLYISFTTDKINFGKVFIQKWKIKITTWNKVFFFRMWCSFVEDSKDVFNSSWRT